MKTGTIKYSKSDPHLFMHCATWVDNPSTPVVSINLIMIPSLVDNENGGKQIEHAYVLQIRDSNHKGEKKPVGVSAALIEKALACGDCPIRRAIEEDAAVRRDVEALSPAIRAMHEKETLLVASESGERDLPPKQPLETRTDIL